MLYDADPDILRNVSIYITFRELALSNELVRLEHYVHVADAQRVNAKRTAYRSILIKTF
jgi:hypothetical protein